MAFPQTAAPTETPISADTTTHNINMPATVNSGDLLLVFLGFGGQNATVTTPSGWTQLWHITAGGSLVGLGAGYARVADGTEGGTTVNFDTGVQATQGSAHAYRVTTWEGTLTGVEVGTAATGSSANPNPPSLTASWGAEDNLWFAACGAADDDGNFTVAPANYTDLASTVSGAGTNAGCSTGSARRELAAATDDPGTFTIDQSERWFANTVVVRPAAAGVVSGAGSSTGAATVAGVGASTAASAGAASAAATVAGAGASTVAAAGAASGAATVAGVGAATVAAAGSATGQAAVSGVGGAVTVIAAAGLAAGVATVAGVGAAATVSSGAGLAAGLATVNGVGTAGVAGAGVATGQATVKGVGAALFFSWVNKPEAGQVWSDQTQAAQTGTDQAPSSQPWAEQSPAGQTWTEQ